MVSLNLYIHHLTDIHFATGCTENKYLCQHKEDNMS